jgi:putative SOS response-associated peptidase YedK
MCGRYAQLADLEELEEAFDVPAGSLARGLATGRPGAGDVEADEATDRASGGVLGPRYNAAPTQALPVLVPRDAPGGEGGWPPVLSVKRWGLRSAADPKALSRPATINARGEGLWRRRGRLPEAFRNRRCLVPASGFYEWRRRKSARRGGRKQPYFLRRRDRRPFAFAGIWSATRGPGGGAWEGFAIVTVPAEGIVADLHHRMPAILRDAESRALWLDPERRDPDELAVALGAPRDRAASLDAFEVYPVDPRVGSPAVDDPELIAPLRRDDGPLFDRAAGVDPDRPGP